MENGVTNHSQIFVFAVFDTMLSFDLRTTRDAVAKLKI